MILNSRVQGNGESVILIHGLFGSLINLSMLSKSLSEYFTVHIIDVRNHGDSPHNEHMDYNTMANDVIRYMDNLGIKSTHLVGHSMGGKISMQIAMNFPDRVNRLVVADIAPVTYENRHNIILKGLLAIDPKKIKSRKEADQILSTYVNEPEVRSFLLKNLEKTSFETYKWRINLKGIHCNHSNISLGPTGSPFHGSTLFVKGGESNYIEAKHSNAMSRLFPNAQLKIMEGTGHWLHAQKPALFKRVVMSFLLE